MLFRKKMRWSLHSVLSQKLRMTRPLRTMWWWLWLRETRDWTIMLKLIGKKSQAQLPGKSVLENLRKVCVHTLVLGLLEAFSPPAAFNPRTEIGVELVAWQLWMRAIPSAAWNSHLKFSSDAFAYEAHFLDYNLKGSSVMYGILEECFCDILNRKWDEEKLMHIVESCIPHWEINLLTQIL